jgi:hypothetical protein
VTLLRWAYPVVALRPAQLGFLGPFNLSAHEPEQGSSPSSTGTRRWGDESGRPVANCRRWWCSRPCLRWGGARLGVVGSPGAHRCGCSMVAGVDRCGSLARGRRRGRELQRRGWGGVSCLRGARGGGDGAGGGPEQAVRAEVARGGLAMVSLVVVWSGAEAVQCRGRKREELHSAHDAFYSRKRRWTPASAVAELVDRKWLWRLRSGARRAVGAPLFRQWGWQAAPHGLIFFLDFPKPFQNCKFKIDVFDCSKNSQVLYETILKYYAQFSKLCQLQITNINHVKNPRIDLIFESSTNFKGSKLSRKNLINSPTFSLDLIFTKVNLVGHTCM